MEWWEKEVQWESTLRQGKQVKDLWRYIPKRLREAVDDVAVDSDGYWVWLADGWTAYDGGEDCQQIHVYTISDLREDLKTVRRC